MSLVRHPKRRLALAGALPVIAAIAIAGCGDLESDTGSASDSRGQLTEATTTTPTQPARDLPPRPSGLVQIQGEVDGSIAEEVVGRFPAFAARNGLAVRAQASNTDEEPGFEALCSGQIDIAAASRRITEAELDACRGNGLGVIDFQVAYDAIVIATRNESDVGADCVNLAQLRAMYGADSPVTSWNQLNPSFSVRRLGTAGPDQQSSNFDFFGARVLGVPNPTLANFRSDYSAFAREQGVRKFVAGRISGEDFRRAGRNAGQVARRLARAQDSLGAADRALRDASAALDAAGRRLDRAVRDRAAGRQERLEQAHDAAKKRQKAAVKQQRQASRAVKRLAEETDEANRGQQRLDRLVPPGAVGIIGFSYYELFEEQLRPLEIDAQTGDRCVFPSDETISSELYPLERTLRLYTTLRSLDRPEVQAYIQFHLQRAENIASDLELIPVPDPLREQEIAKIKSAQTTTSATQAEGTGEALEGGGDQTTTDEATTAEDPTGTATTTTEGG